MLLLISTEQETHAGNCKVVVGKSCRTDRINKRMRFDGRDVSMISKAFGYANSYETDGL
jgi:hypothetical protein